MLRLIRTQRRTENYFPHGGLLSLERSGRNKLISRWGNLDSPAPAATWFYFNYISMNFKSTAILSKY